MFSLRKRFKSIEENSSKETSRIQFESLPAEVYYLIFDYLSGRDLIKLRLVNSFFKNLIDQAKHLWLTQLVVHVKIKRKLDMNHFFEFISYLNNDYLIIDCLKEIKHQENVFKLENKLLKIEFKFLNTLSFTILNFFSNNCTELKIDSFLNTHGQIKSEYKQSVYEVSLNSYKNLKYLNISCLLYDSNQNKYFIRNDIYLDEFFQNKFKLLFVNIRELKLKYYAGSNKRLVKCLKNLANLTSLELDESQFTQDDYALRESRNKLDIKNLSLVSVNLTLCLLILKRVTNLTKLENIKLKLSNNNNKSKMPSKEINDLLSNLNCNIHVIS